MSSSDLVYAQLRTSILEGRLQPGAPLKERDLCAVLEVSRTPVREALRRLSAEGLAEARPRRSSVVASFAADEIAEIFELGVMLESYLAGLAAQKATATDINDLATLVDDMRALLGKPIDELRATFQRLDQRFHQRLGEIANSPRISETLRQTVSFGVLSQIFKNYDILNYSRSVDQHVTVLDAIRRGEVRMASNAMRRHIEAGRKSSK